MANLGDEFETGELQKANEQSIRYHISSCCQLAKHFKLSRFSRLTAFHFAASTCVFSWVLFQLPLEAFIKLRPQLHH